MPKSYLEFYRELQDEGYFERLAIDPMAQFGTETEPFLGATLLPELKKDENSYEETQIRYRTMPATDGTRYSPAQLDDSGYIIGTMKVDFGHTDTAAQLTGQDHDGLVKLLERGGDMEAIAEAIMWSDKALLRPHLIKNEIQRWQAICNALVVRRGSNGYTEDVLYYNPLGHRVNSVTGSGTVGAPTGWYEPVAGNYDPFAKDIFPLARKLSQLGYRVNRIISSMEIYQTLLNNPTVALRVGGNVALDSGTKTLMAAIARHVTTEDLNRILATSGYSLPPIEVYDRTYMTKTGYNYFLPEDKFVMLCTTGRDAQIDLGDKDTFMTNTLGYYGIGRPAGAAKPGRVIHTEIQERKPKGLYGESYQTGLPVITEPEAIGVITIAKPTS